MISHIAHISARAKGPCAPAPHLADPLARLRRDPGKHAAKPARGTPAGVFTLGLARGPIIKKKVRHGFHQASGLVPKMGIDLGCKRFNVWRHFFSCCRASICLFWPGAKDAKLHLACSSFSCASSSKSRLNLSSCCCVCAVGSALRQLLLQIILKLQSLLLLLQRVLLLRCLHQLQLQVISLLMQLFMPWVTSVTFCFNALHCCCSFAFSALSLSITCEGKELPGLGSGSSEICRLQL